MNSYIKESAFAVTQQHRIDFDSLNETNTPTEEAMQEIRFLFQQNKVMLNEGLRCLSEKFSGFVAEISTKLLAHLHSPEEIAKIISAEIQDNEHALTLFSEAANSFYDCGDYHREQCVLSVYLLLFPLHPEPYACYAALLGRKKGITAAESVYTQLIDSMEDPVLDYFAADWHLKNGNPTKAKELIQRAITKTQTSLHEQQNLQQHLLGLSNQCR